MKGVAPWPVCTVRGCGHSIWWDTLAERRRAVDRHQVDWVTDRGLAHCTCHDDGGFPVEAFPCGLGKRP